jgi:asparagine synthase (glutamine-hydrolysing)
VAVVTPFTDPHFVSALARAGGARGFPSRAAALQTFFSDVLPPALPARTSKASFDAVLWNRHARAFAHELREGLLAGALRGAGLEDVVHAEALGEHWSHETPPAANSFLVLQACWLATRGAGAGASSAPA